MPIELEYYECGDLVVYPNDPEPADPDGDPTEPLFSLVNPAPDVAEAEFRRRGWV